MKFVFLTASSKLPPWLDQTLQDYQTKISRWIPTQVQVINTENLPRAAKNRKIKSEGESLEKNIKSDDFVVLLDERGRSLDTMTFSKKLENALNSGKKRIVVIVGGAYGVSDAVRQRSHLQMRLSDFTMTHHLALLVAMEQFYRGMTILKGIEYHNA